MKKPVVRCTHLNSVIVEPHIYWSLIPTWWFYIGLSRCYVVDSMRREDTGDQLAQVRVRYGIPFTIGKFTGGIYICRPFPARPDPYLANGLPVLTMATLGFAASSSSER